MSKLKTRIWLFFITIFAFVVPFGVIMAVERTKQADKLAQSEKDYLAMQVSSDQTRSQYYLDVAQRKNELKQAMDDNKARYEELLKNQPSIIADHQKQVSQTTTQAVVTKQVVQSASKSSGSSSSSQSKSSSPTPKATTTTKAS